ncbi:predicted protein [Sclerotinia sclerotiorum 1980 UF-70]|uniref:Uncharacterized protein n=1 Tax=Sclerotinia sclerotiorum (strain ATCC 18683 / 1980 / Ss-1) TaxID=665079 RepID=A7ESE9_SCLS1|nr:predicted protein [Sclerotinia sclerotiorum 1980 UF-70]EDN92391.1 predicted protein [Sclerotinia sclerotiorum 1980 UF-70]
MGSGGGGRGILNRVGRRSSTFPSSVQAIAGIEKYYRDQVIDSYAEALRVVYGFGLGVSV